MSSKEILEKAIQKAIDGGWDSIDGLTFTRAWMPNESYIKFNTIETGNIEVGGTAYSINDVIFSHDFAKALWGEGNDSKPLVFRGLNEDLNKIEEQRVMLEHEHRTATKAWQYHLQNMVIAEDPIKYLAENI